MANASGGQSDTTSVVWLRQHIGLFATGLLFVWVVLRVLVETRGDTTSALAVLQASGTVSVALGVIATSFSVFLIILLLTLEVVRQAILKRRAGERNLTTTILGMSQVHLAVVGLGYLPVLYVMLYGGLYALVAAPRFRRFSPYASTTEMARVMLVALVPVLLFFASTTMWLPLEALTFTEDQETVVLGYVLNESDRWVTYLAERERIVVRGSTPTLTDRTICSRGRVSWLWTSLTKLGKASLLPLCPDVDLSRA